MEKSTHKVEVMPLIRETHPNADKLSVIRVYGYTAVINTADWDGKDKAAYLPPDSLAPIKRPEFEWLKNTTKTFYNANSIKCDLESPEEVYVRVTAKKFRKVLSYGLFAPVPPDVQIGDNVAEMLGVKHFNPPESMETGGEVASPPKVYSSKYDVDSFQRYAAQVFVPGEEVICTEKIHGANGRWVFNDGFHCGSHNEWKKEYPTGGGMQNLWWKVLRQYPVIMEWLQAHPDHVLCGEVYGAVQSNMRYGTAPGEIRIAIFDIMKNGVWIEYDEAKELAKDLPWVPLVARTSFDLNKIIDLAEGPSLVPGADHFREGIVVCPVKERISDEIGRVKLKVVSPSYLEKC